ncbi:MAG TPA: class I SAM-dependent methyltransferase [Blastocatellia bacterium]|nr:class I SAM-dependent methyltransferase [Blastocatellia bacterium]
MKSAGTETYNFTAPLFSSFRDPAGRLLKINGRIIRVVNESGVPDLEAFMNSKTSRRFVERGRLVGTEMLGPEMVSGLLEEIDDRESLGITDGSKVAEHEPISFQNYPYEWPPEMLHSAASLTLDLAQSALDEGLGLKDATPYNILFRGAEPVFVDLLSFERRRPGDPIWLPQAQFERTFLLPLLANKYFGMSPDTILSARRDGLEPEEIYRMCGRVRRLLPPFLSMVSLPVWLASRHDEASPAIYKSRELNDAEKARFILGSVLKRLRRLLKKLEPEDRRKSAWSDYMAANNNYSESHFNAKNEFVRRALAEFEPRRVLDVGCNTGHYSAMAARQGASVTSIDYDPVVVGETWRRAQAERLNVLPLVVNLTRPTPSTGWRNAECASFLDRARGSFDAVLMLAVLHHMLVSERIPLPEIIELASELTTDLLILEFVSPEDSMFRRLTRGRDHLFAGLSPEAFEDACGRKFEIVRSQHLENTSRWLYLLRKR